LVRDCCKMIACRGNGGDKVCGLICARTAMQPGLVCTLWMRGSTPQHEWMEVSDRIWTKRSRVLRGWGPTVMVGGSNGPCQQVLCPEQRERGRSKRESGFFRKQNGYWLQWFILLVPGGGGGELDGVPTGGCAGSIPVRSGACACPCWVPACWWMGSGHQLSCTTACTTACT
jgi:hypothetical protein